MNQPKPDKKVRADAQRNLELLLKSATELFLNQGIDVPVRTIASHAGVGIGTLYRHFPKRSDLIVAVFRQEVDACANFSAPQEEALSPIQALEKWIDQYANFIVSKRGMVAALNTENQAYAELPNYLLERLQPILDQLLSQAVAAKEIRAGVSAEDMLYAIAGLCTPPRCAVSRDARHMVSIFVDGLKYTAN